MTDYDDDYRPGFRERVGDWVFDNLGTVLLGILGAFFVLIAISLVAVSASHNRFMEGCMQDRPEYECTAMWRAGYVPVR